MRLNVKDASGMLNVSENTIYQWIRHRNLPHYRIEEQFRFNREELLEWATSSGVDISPYLASESQPLPTLAEALEAGGIHYQVQGQDKASVLEAVVATLPLPAEVDRSFLYQILLAREALGSTGIGNGIAIPHVRNPIVLNVPRPMISLCFLARPTEFGSLDGRPVEMLFILICSTVRSHLSMLSKLSIALRDPGFEKAISNRASREVILSVASQLENSPKLISH